MLIYVGTAAFGCPVERSSTRFGPVEKVSSLDDSGSSALSRTAECAYPHRTYSRIGNPDAPRCRAAADLVRRRFYKALQK
jgi:hypothetical protein